MQRKDTNPPRLPFVLRSTSTACQDAQFLTIDDHNVANWLFKDIEALDYFAGDVERVPSNLWASLEKLRAKRGQEIYADLMAALTHQQLPPEEAQLLWNDILKHKYFMSEKLKRNVGIRVAVLDFLENHRGLKRDLRLLPEKDLDCLLLFVNEDGLTGLYNHRYFQEQIRHELSRAKRYNRHVSLLLMDLDRFKLFNDQYGHRRGDQLLKDISQFFLGTRRESDTVARYGGDEFAVILPETKQDEAVLLAKRLRADFEQKRFGYPLEGETFVTISIGVAAFPEDATAAEELIEQADQALYHAKRAGRNCVRGGKTEKKHAEVAHLHH